MLGQHVPRSNTGRRGSTTRNRRATMPRTQTGFAFALAAAAGLFAGAAHADGMPMVKAMDQDMSNGVISAEMIYADANGWMVVHRTGDDMKPGPVVGYAPLRAGENTDVAALLTE